MYFVKKKELIMYLIYYSYIWFFFVVQNSGKENLQLCIHRSRRKDERDGEVFFFGILVA